LPLAGGDASTLWTELPLGRHTHAPATELSRSVTERIARVAASSTLERLRLKIEGDQQLLAHWNGRSYLNLSALVHAAKNVPLVTPEIMIHALGVGSLPLAQRLAGEAAARQRSSWRVPLVVSALLRQQVEIEGEVEQLHRRVRRDSRGLAGMDLTLLPSDAMTTTLASAQALVERAAELWVRCATSLFSLQLGAAQLVRRRVPDAELTIGYSLVMGVDGALSVTLAERLQHVAQVLRGDPAAAEKLADRSVTSPAALPDGPGRGALGQFIGVFGDLALDAFELSRPRWRENARDVMDMLLALLSQDGGASAPAARVLADRELARYEPALSGVERRLLRALIDRARAVLRLRVSVDRELFSALRLLRRALLDVDRRLRRIDSDLPADGVFHCSIERLMGALKSGRPELGRVIRMRQVEREQQRHEPAPPVCFAGSPPRGGIPILPHDSLHGLGVSPGVVEGAVRLVGERLPSTLGRDDILVVNSVDPCLAPLLACGGGVVAETGGGLSLGAEAARELACPAVFGVQNAGLQLRDGERVRIDGERGTVQRIDPAEASRN
jgi:pyruvate,water dikinase